jgi:hypothetical protein
MPETITEPSKASKLGTPDIPASQAVFTVYASTKISAPAALVFRTLRNTDTWRDWNKFCQRVNITSQPSEDEDDTTLAEIQQLVRNTSVAGSVDSAITDGAASQGTGLIGRRMSIEEEDRVRGAPPPVTRVSLRRQSLASQHSGSGRPSSQVGRSASVASGQDASALAAMAVANVNGVAHTDHARQPSEQSNPAIQVNGSPPLSGAQKFQQSQEARRSSVASGQQPESTNNVLVEAPHDSNLLMPAPPNTEASQKASNAQKRKSVAPATKKRLNIHALYGEPSVRIQIGTRMTLNLLRRVITGSFGTDREMMVLVNEVSRPEDNEAGTGSGDVGAFFNNALNGDLDDTDDPHMRRVSRMQTHLEAKTPGVYRIVWTMLEGLSPPKAYPKWLLTAQRVHEIRRVVAGDGKEECVYEDWECWKGMLASKTGKKNLKYWDERAKEWGYGLGSYCEAMGGDVERRDFVS